MCTCVCLINTKSCNTPKPKQLVEKKDHFSRIILTWLALLASSRLSSKAFFAFEMVEETDCAWTRKLLHCR